YDAPSFGAADLDWIRRQVRMAKASTAYPVFVAVELMGPNPVQLGAIWDDGSTWDHNVELWDSRDLPVTYWPLGHVWEEEGLIYASQVGAPPAWDAPAGDGDVWDEGTDAFASPQNGWP